MQKELDNLKDILTFEKQNLELTIYDCDKFSLLCNEKDVELNATLLEKRSLEMRLPKLSSQGSKKTIPEELVNANNQVFEKIHEELKARSMLSTIEETKKRLLSEKSSFEAKNVELEKKKSSEVCCLNIFCFAFSALRFVNLSHTGIRSLPSSIHSLCQLQSPILQNCNELKSYQILGIFFCR
ncbi:hypothetical protein R3W88_016239 [Solanum pinnatisectum]|uniref:Uncharacterized protein n=1 Tax=Solanum pinnatisectum TaxID=50273 RepID=A0AAV9KX38_9SOLN|nr:hypothetical protein R3W88_016239 [Solanum pinnatisectum]